MEVTEHDKGGPTRNALLPQWTARGTREELATLTMLAGLVIKELGWYELPAGAMALVSDPRTADDSESVLVSVWPHDPRELLSEVIEMSTESVVLPALMRENWAKLREVSMAVIGRLRSSPSGLNPDGSPKALPDSLPDVPPRTARLCGDLSTGGHLHIGPFTVGQFRLSAEEHRRAREAGSRVTDTAEALFLDDVILVVDF